MMLYIYIYIEIWQLIKKLYVNILLNVLVCGIHTYYILQVIRKTILFIIYHLKIVNLEQSQPKIAEEAI